MRMVVQNGRWVYRTIPRDLTPQAHQAERKTNIIHFITIAYSAASAQTINVKILLSICKARTLGLTEALEFFALSDAL